MKNLSGIEPSGELHLGNDLGAGCVRVAPQGPEPILDHMSGILLGGTGEASTVGRAMAGARAELGPWR